MRTSVLIQTIENDLKIITDRRILNNMKHAIAYYNTHRSRIADSILRARIEIFINNKYEKRIYVDYKNHGFYEFYCDAPISINQNAEFIQYNVELYNFLAAIIDSQGMSICLYSIAIEIYHIILNMKADYILKSSYIKGCLVKSMVLAINIANDLFIDEDISIAMTFILVQCDIKPREYVGDIIRIMPKILWYYNNK